MLELTGLGTFFRILVVLYWLVAIGALVLALWKLRPAWTKAAGALAVVLAFGYLPMAQYLEAREEAKARAIRDAYAKEAWAYFKKLCDEKSGQKIYKTFTGIRSVLVTKPLPPASPTDLYDQFWYGDPYSGGIGERRPRSAASSLMAPMASKGSEIEVRGFEFVEQLNVGDGKSPRLIRYTLTSRGEAVSQGIDRAVSRFAVAWEDISTPADRKYWVAGGRLTIVDQTDNSVVAERIGYFIEAGFGSTGSGRRPWSSSRGPNTTCPRIESSFHEDRFFIHKALVPAQEASHGK